MRVARRYTVEFKEEAIALMRRGGRSFPELSRDLGVSIFSLRAWYKADEMARKKGKRPKLTLTNATALAKETPEQRIERLERENAKLLRQVERLEEDREILKKAAAFF